MMLHLYAMLAGLFFGYALGYSFGRDAALREKQLPEWVIKNRGAWRL